MLVICIRILHISSVDLNLGQYLVYQQHRYTRSAVNSSITNKFKYNYISSVCKIGVVPTCHLFSSPDRPRPQGSGDT